MSESKLAKEEAILAEEKELLKEEKRILAEEKEIAKKVDRSATFVAIIVVVLVVGAIGGVGYWLVSRTHIKIDKAEISASSIELAPHTAGIFEELYVHEGDRVVANTAVARVGAELIKTKNAGLVIAVKDSIGKIINPGEAVVTMIDTDELHVIGRIDEDKGLKDVRINQRATFTVDAFGSRQFEGIVDEISPSSRQGDVVFSISDKREVKQFDIKIRFNIDKYPELKNGMSAKITIYK